MNFLRQNWIAVVFIIAVIASTIMGFRNTAAVERESDARDRKTVAAQVEGCVSNSARTAIGAQGWLRLSDRVRERGNPGDEKSADTYAATAGGMIAEIAAPAGYEGSRSLVQVDEIPDERAAGGYRIAPTEAAKKLHREGCERRYKQ